MRALALAQAKAERRARIAKAAAAKRARIAAAQAAAEKRARIAAANAWHRGYFQQDANVYYRFTDANCQDYAQDGCWHVEVITRDGCPSYVAVNANEYQGGAIINALLDNQGYGVPPQTPRVFELDADPGNVTINDVTIECN